MRNQMEEVEVELAEELVVEAELVEELVSKVRMGMYQRKFF